MDSVIYDKIVDMSVDFSSVLANIELTLDELRELKEGSVIKLNKKVDENSLIYINSKVVGDGEITIKNSKFAIKINRLKFKESL